MNFTFFRGVSLFQQAIAPLAGIAAEAMEQISTLNMTLTDHLHTGPAMKIVNLLNEYPKVRLSITRSGKPEAEVRPSIIHILLMAVSKGETVTFRAEGQGAADVLRRLHELNEAVWYTAGPLRLNVRRILGKTPQKVVDEVLRAMEYFDKKEIWGIYHVQLRRLYVGGIVNGHREIADSVGFKDSAAYTRINFDARSGKVVAYFPSELPGENLLGRLVLRKWLAELFFRKRAP